MAVPRIVTADSTGTIARIVRSAIDLLEISVIHIDVPTGNEALEEALKANLAITAFQLDEDMKGFEFALRVKKDSPETSVIIVGEEHDPGEFDEETAMDSPFIYMSRPVDIHKFLRVFMAGLESHAAMVNALATPSTKGNSSSPTEFGSVPQMDMDKAQGLINRLLQDVGAMAITLATRAGETLLEGGASGYIDRDQLSTAILPTMQANINIRELIGGEISSIQFYDGDDYDIFVLTIGLHHSMCVIFPGQQGRANLGMVVSRGRKAVQEFIALLGANAFMIQQPAKKEPERKKRPLARSTQEAAVVDLVRATIHEPKHEPEEKVVQPEPSLQLEPIEDLNLDELFGEDFDEGDDLFSLESMESAAKEIEEQERKGTLDWGQAQELGFLDK